MNGTTTIDATLNPCSAEADRHTYGWRLLNVSTWGNRLIRVGVLGVYLDLYRSRRLPWMRRFLYTRVRNGASFDFPGGSLIWPMPDKANHVVRIPSSARGCKGKANLGRHYAQQADRLSAKHGKRYGVYRCPHCGGTHLTTKIENAGLYAPLLHVTANVTDQRTAVAGTLDGVVGHSESGAE